MSFGSGRVSLGYRVPTGKFCGWRGTIWLGVSFGDGEMSFGCQGVSFGLQRGEFLLVLMGEFWFRTGKFWLPSTDG